MDASEPALFQRFPALRERIPHSRLLAGPTPVIPCSLPGCAPGTLYVKCDDASSPLYGGNKPRKLEFILGHALARGAKRWVTTGGLGTNHGLATTILGAASGLETTLVLVRQPITPEVREKLALYTAYGAEVIYGAGVVGTALRTAAVLARDRARRLSPYLVATGGSSTRGNLGFVSAGLELARQIEQGLLPEPKRIYIPVGTGGSAAGILLGLALANLRPTLVGVLVTDILPPSQRGILRSAERIRRKLLRLDPSLPAVDCSTQPFELVRDQLGPGYGAATPESRAAVSAAREQGIHLDTTYTGKALASILAPTRDPSEGPLLFWNTYNSVDVSAQAPPAHPETLPAKIRSLLDRDAKK